MSHYFEEASNIKQWGSQLQKFIFPECSPGMDDKSPDDPGPRQPC